MFPSSGGLGGMEGLALEANACGYSDGLNFCGCLKRDSFKTTNFLNRAESDDTQRTS